MQPETGCLACIVAELPRLNDLIRLAVQRGHDSNGILYGDAWYRCVHHGHEEVNRRLPPSLRFVRRVQRAAMRHRSIRRDSQVRALRACNHQIPTIAQHSKHIALNMLTRPLARLQITTPCIMSACSKRITHDTATLASHENTHPLRFGQVSHSSPGTRTHTRTQEVAAYAAATHSFAWHTRRTHTRHIAGGAIHVTSLPPSPAARLFSCSSTQGARA